MAFRLVRTLLTALFSAAFAASCATAPGGESASWARQGERVRWAPGHERRMQTGDAACAADARPGVRQRIVSAAANEWRRFGYPIVDMSAAPPRLVPDDAGAAIVPDAANPELAPNHRARRATRLGLMEDDASAMLAIGAYWAVTDASEIGRQNRIWAIEPAAGWATPWSAAFVSYIMCAAGLTDAQFPRSKAHVDYIADVYDGRDGLAFRYQRNGDGPIEPGDLICSWRGLAQPLEYEEGRTSMARAGRPTGSHCDVVVRVDPERRRIQAIGGNVVQAVSMTILQYEGDESHMRLEAPPDFPGARPWFAVLRLAVADAGAASLDAAFAPP